jgi:hypothetical protein
VIVDHGLRRVTSQYKEKLPTSWGEERLVGSVSFFATEERGLDALPANFQKINGSVAIVDLSEIAAKNNQEVSAREPTVAFLPKSNHRVNRLTNIIRRV